MSGGLADGTRLRVAGAPSAEEIAAAVAALDVAAPRRPRIGRDSGRPAWIRAARIEALGGAPATSPADLRRRG